MHRAGPNDSIRLPIVKINGLSAPFFAAASSLSPSISEEASGRKSRGDVRLCFFGRGFPLLFPYPRKPAPLCFRPSPSPPLGRCPSIRVFMRSPSSSSALRRLASVLRSPLPFLSAPPGSKCRVIARGYNYTVGEKLYSMDACCSPTPVSSQIYPPVVAPMTSRKTSLSVPRTDLSHLSTFFGRTCRI